MYKKLTLHLPWIICFIMNLSAQLPSNARSPEMSSVISGLRRVRVGRIGMVEQNLVDLMADALKACGYVVDREVRLAPKCRIDIVVSFANDIKIGVEAKRGRPNKTSATAQVRRYAETSRLSGIVFVAERAFDMPDMIADIPVAVVSLYAGMGISL